jgi:DNA-directed RNA polymerase subunit RPC12/RpoP
MDIENITLNENLTLKPLPPKIVHCYSCKTNFISRLKMNAEYYKTCEECRHKIRLQGRKHRKKNKQFISDLK